MQLQRIDESEGALDVDEWSPFSASFQLLQSVPINMTEEIVELERPQQLEVFEKFGDVERFLHRHK